MDKAREEEVQRQEEFIPPDVQEEEEEDPWIKKYIERLQFRELPPDVLEAVRRYDLPQNLQISTPYQNRFWRDVFFYFGNGSSKRYRGKKWIDYRSFKEICRLSGIVDMSQEFPEHCIDIVYSRQSKVNS